MNVAERKFYRHLTILLVAYLLLSVIGATGYSIIEGWSWTDSLYMTVITISTVGFGEIHPLSQAGRIFTSFLIVAGVVATAYVVSTVADFIVAGEFRGHLWRKRMQDRIGKLRNHYIVCGYGRVGEQVTNELLTNAEKLVVIERQAELGPELEAINAIPVKGNATEDAVLLQAGIEKASGICCCLPNDSDNVYVALTARALNPSLTIISRANSFESERKLRIAGAHHVINPYVTSGRRMARQLIHPNILEFMDVVMHRGEVNILIEYIRLGERSQLRDKNIPATEIRRRIGANILAVRRPDGETIVNPGVELSLRAADTMIALGTPEQLDLLASEADDNRHSQTRRGQ